MASLDLTPASSREFLPLSEKENIKQFVTMIIDGQMFGVPVFAVQDVLKSQKITKIPLAPPAIFGSINLRGRIVTVIDMRTRLSLPPVDDSTNCMHVVAEFKDEQYSFIVDRVGEVLDLPLSDFERNPPNLSKNWQDVSLGIYRLETQLLIILDIEKLLETA